MKNDTQQNEAVKKYVESLNDEQFSSLYDKCRYNDQAEIGEFLSQTPDMDAWLRTAKGPYELFDLFDIVVDLVKKESRRRPKEQ